MILVQNKVGLVDFVDIRMKWSDKKSTFITATTDNIHEGNSVIIYLHPQ